jgi:hypothetical protein
VINNFIYDDNYFRTIPACIIDGRNGNAAVSGQIGTVIKAFNDAEILKSRQPGVIPYKMETINGNLAGYMSLQVSSGTASLYQLWLREAFKGNMAEIQEDISIFIASLSWMYDALL